MIGNPSIPQAAPPKVVVKNGKVYHQYPDGRMVYVRPASTATAGPGVANVPARPAADPSAPPSPALQAAAQAAGVPVSTLASGYYDPGLLSQQNAADRGYGDLQADTGTGLSRLTSQYGIDTAGVNRQSGYNAADLQQQLDRGTQDHASNLAALQRSYDRLKIAQQEQANQAGVIHGGALLQAAAKRAANQAFDQQPVDTQFQRLKQDTATGLQRNTDNTTAQLGQLGVNLGNQSQDLTTALGRGGRENAQFHVDTGGEIAYQAAQNGFLPPALQAAAQAAGVAPGGAAHAAAPAAAPTGGLAGSYYKNVAPGLAAQPKVVVKDGYVWHYYPDGRKVRVRPANGA